MNNYGRRLRSLEPKPYHSERLEEVSLRLIRYAIERRHVVFKYGPPVKPRPGDAGSAEFEAIYEKMKTHPRFSEMLRDVEAGHFIDVSP